MKHTLPNGAVFEGSVHELRDAGFLGNAKSAKSGRRRKAMNPEDCSPEQRKLYEAIYPGSAFGRETAKRIRKILKERSTDIVNRRRLRSLLASDGSPRLGETPANKIVYGMRLAKEVDEIDTGKMNKPLRLTKKGEAI